MNRISRYILYKIKVFAIVCSVSICFYFIARVILFSFAHYNEIDKIFGFFLILGESYILMHSFGYMLDIFKIASKAKTTEVPIITDYPAVAVIVAARHEPKNVLEETIATLTTLNYPNLKIILLDDSSEEKYIQEADELGKEFSIDVFRRQARHGAKAGIVNDFIRNIDAKYIAIFDADQNPMPDFLKRIIPLLENDDKLAFVQTPQFYTNIEDSPIAKGSAIQQAIFYESICEGKSINNAMFCCGTNVVFRKEALDRVGGFDENSITEDFATSVKLHLAGYKSLYYNHVYAFGMAPQTLSAYFRQQSRWAAGTIDVFRRIIKMFFRKAFKLTPVQWWEYILAGTYYFVGWAFFLLMICPIAYLLLDVPSFFIRPEIYFVTFVPYFLLALLIFYSSMGERRYKASDIYHGTILGLLSFPILMKAAAYGLAGKKAPFMITAKGKGEAMPLNQLWPWMVMLVLNVSAVFVGIFKITYRENFFPVLVNIFWAVYHIFILANIFYFNASKRSDIIKAVLVIIPCGLGLAYIFR